MEESVTKLKSLDTNVLVRFLTRDDEAQAAKALRLLSKEQCFISIAAFAETAYVLISVYGVSREDIVHGLSKTLRLRSVLVENSPIAELTLALFAKGLDFGDALVLASSRTASSVVTFDTKFAKKAAPLGVTPVRLL